MYDIRKLEYLHDRRIIYRRMPITDQPTEIYDWGQFHEEGTFECYELFKTEAKITSLKSFKWHLYVLWYLNSDMTEGKFNNLARFIANEKNGFVVFSIRDSILENMIEDVKKEDLERPPNNKMRKVIFKDMSGLSKKEKLSIVGVLIGRTKRINGNSIRKTMLQIHESGNKITLRSLSKLMNCAERTLLRNMDKDLKKEKQQLNRNLK